MTAVDTRPATATEAACVKRDGDEPCTGRPVVRYAVGLVCSRHQLPGAEVYEWLTDPAVFAAADPDRVVEVLAEVAYAPLGPPLPNPARAKAARHADAGTGEESTARLVAYKAGKLRAVVLDYLVSCGPRGTTAIEAWRWYQRTHNPNTDRYSIAPRLSELETDGWAVLTGEMRNVRGPGFAPEGVYVLSARGRREKGLTW